MGDQFFAPNGPSFNDLFEPDAGGLAISGFYDTNGNALRYAPINLGSKGQDVGFYHPDGPDVSNYWAARGSVGYTVAMGDIGMYVSPFAPCPSTKWHQVRNTNQHILTFRRNGTWDLWHMTRNYTALVVRSGSGGLGYLYPDGRYVQSGNWAQSPRADFGDTYTISYTHESIDRGRWWIPKPANENTWQWQPGVPGSFTNSTIVITGEGQDMPLNTDRALSLVLDMTTLANNSVYQDPNAVLRVYNRGWFRILIKRNGNVLNNFVYYYNMVNDFCDLDIVVAEGGSTGGGSGGGGGGGGGGGCVATDMWMDHERQAHEIAIGDWIDGSSYDPDIITLRQVRANQVMPQPCFRLTTVSGISIVASDSTPMTMPDGSCKMFGPQMYGELVLVDDRGEIRWEAVADIKYVGIRNVVLFNVDDQSYFAGEQGDRRIATHNAGNQKQAN